MIAWRIATETREYRANDLSGLGAAKNPGRWNNKDEAVVYAAMTRSLAVLETAAHLDSNGFPMNRFLVEIDIPDAVWDAREEVSPKHLDAAWCAIPAGGSSANFGSTWLRSGRSPILLVPSVIVPEEPVVLINRAHAACAAIKAKAVRKFEYDLLFRQ